MAAETLLLLNPRKRKRKSRSGKRRTAAQRAATRKLVAFMKRRRSGRKSRARKSSPSTTGVSTMKRRYRRNPISKKSVSVSVNSAMALLKPAAAGAAGALALNGIVNYTPIPDMLKAGKMMYVTRSVLALLIGVVGSKVGPLRPYARSMALGGLTVTLADLGKELASGTGVNLSGVGYINPGWIATPRVAGRGGVPGVMGRTAQYLPSARPMQRAGSGQRMSQYVRA